VAAVVGACAIDPTLTVELPKAERFTRWLEALRARAAQTPSAVHRFSAAEPAMVWIDGRLAGVAPLELRLTRGLHRVVATAPGRERSQLQVDTTSSTETSLPLGPALTSPTVRALRAAVRDGTPLPPAVPLPLYVVRLDPRPTVQRLTDAMPRTSVPLEAVTAEAVLHASSPVSLTEPATPTPTRTFRLPMVLSLVAGGLLAVASAITFGLGQSAFSRAQLIPQLDTRAYADTMIEGRTLVGGSAALLGAAALAASVGLFFAFD
jgi:hypothetical protein